MNDMIYVGLGVVGVVALIAMYLISLSHGLHASLNTARVGEVYNFEYEQPLHGERKRILARVIEPVHTLDNATIRKLNSRSSYRRNDPLFQRTSHLVTCQTFDGEIRQFYAERAKNVRRSLFGGVLLKTGLASLLF